MPTLTSVSPQPPPTLSLATTPPNNQSKPLTHQHPPTTTLPPTSLKDATASQEDDDGNNNKEEEEEDEEEMDQGSKELAEWQKKDRQRRVSHSRIERRRREKINLRFAQLRRLIPACAQREDLHKLAVLENAIEHILFLRGALGGGGGGGVGGRQ
ncbi:hypothetical protein HDU67_010245, partial [Dinochytrium kinnereticum]